MRAFLDQRLFGPIGMTDADPRFDDAGNWVGSSYVHAPARQFARFGELYLRDGCVGDERVLPAGWVDHARTTIATDPETGFGYGRHWWTWPDQPGSVAAHGYEGQYVVVLPEHDAVVVHLGKTDAAVRAPLHRPAPRPDHVAGRHRRGALTGLVRRKVRRGRSFRLSSSVDGQEERTRRAIAAVGPLDDDPRTTRPRSSFRRWCRTPTTCRRSVATGRRRRPGRFDRCGSRSRRRPSSPRSTSSCCRWSPDFRNAWRGIRLIEPGYVVAGFGLQLASWFAYSLLTKSALGDAAGTVSRWRFFRIQMSTKALSNIVPGGNAAGVGAGLPPAHAVGHQRTRRRVRAGHGRAGLGRGAEPDLLDRA